MPAFDVARLDCSFRLRNGAQLIDYRGNCCADRLAVPCGWAARLGYIWNLLSVSHPENMTESDESWTRALEETLAAGERIGNTLEQFNEACEHITQLLQDASVLLESGSHATSAFLSISALEETAKVHMGMYRRSAILLKRSKDPLYKHARKHELALGPTIAMGNRLQAAIGDARMRELIELGRTGGLVRLRESSLYVEPRGELLQVPRDAILPEMSRELLLLAIESFDDAVVGYTNKTFELSEQKTDTLFLKWAGV